MARYLIFRIKLFKKTFFLSWLHHISTFLVERYDPRQNKWSTVAPMFTRRKHLGCAVFNNLIYACGGRDDCMELSSAERYNPHTNTWSPIVAMTSRRSGVGLAVVNGQLYAVGGFDGTAYLKTVEVYDTEQNHWRLCGTMNYRRLGGGVGVMRAPDDCFWYFYLFIFFYDNESNKS